MKVFCSECENEIKNKEVLLWPRILHKEEVSSNGLFKDDCYFAVAEVRNMCEKCGHVENIPGVSVEIKPSDILDFLQKRIESVDKCGGVEEKSPEADKDFAIRDFMMKVVHLLTLKYGNGSLGNITIDNISDDLSEVYQEVCRK